MIPSASMTAPDVRDMAIVHRVYRREFDLAPRILRDLRPEQDTRRVAVQRWLATVLAGVHHHHTAEDAMVFPVLAGRISDALIATMAEQHEEVDRTTSVVQACLAQWEAGVPGAVEALARAYEEALPVLARHLDDEERDIVPLIARHMTAEEYGRMATSGNGVVEPWVLTMSFGAMVEECSEEDAAFMIGHLPEDFQRTWYDHASAEYAELMALVRGGVA